MNDLFIIACRNKYRFESSKMANLQVEHLFDLPLKSKNGHDLDSVARLTNAQLKEQTEESFVETASNPLKADLETKLEIVKGIIALKQAENEAARLAASKNEQKRQIIDAIHAAKTRELSQASVDELLARLAKLDG